MTRKSPLDNDPLANRQRTDRSLSAERAKTDRSFADRRRDDEARTDQRRSDRRDSADEKRTEDRQTRDAARTEDRGNGMSREEERERADARLNAEREEADSALSAERERVDRSVQQERQSAAEDASEFFGTERKRTDRDLGREREGTDGIAARASALLKDEQAAHEFARSALALRDDFLGHLGDDLREPLRGINVAAERLRQMAQRRGASPEGREQIDIVGRNAREVTRLLGDILERIATWGAERPNRSGRDRRKPNH